MNNYTSNQDEQESLKVAIREKLQQIIDPDLNQDIVSLGFVKNISFTSLKEVKVTLELTTPACPVKEIFRQKATDLIKSIPGVTNVKIDLLFFQKNLRNTGSHLDLVKNIIAVSSCKGGVGKSTVASMLAVELAYQGYHVGLLDLDIFGPSLPTLFGVSLKGVSARNRKMLPHNFSILKKNNFDSTDPNLDNSKPILKLMSFGFLLGDSPAIMRGPMVSNYIQQLLYQVDWGELDYLFVDMPPGTGDTQLTVSQSVRLDGAIIVTTPQSLSLVDVAKGIIMFEKVKVPILGLVENMAYFICDNCNHRHYPFSGKENTGIKGLQNRFGIPLLAQLPFLEVPKVFFKNYHSLLEAVEMVNQTVREIGKKTVEKAILPKIEFNDKEIQLTWKEKQVKIKNFVLRSHCPCAGCVDEFTGEQKLRVEDISQEIAPLKIELLGNYALSIEWNDKHNSGIYPYKMIMELAKDSN